VVDTDNRFASSGLIFTSRFRVDADDERDIADADTEERRRKFEVDDAKNNEGFCMLDPYGEVARLEREQNLPTLFLRVTRVLADFFDLNDDDPPPLFGLMVTEFRFTVVFITGVEMIDSSSDLWEPLRAHPSLISSGLVAPFTSEPP